jgi:hypothetical protein
MHLYASYRRWNTDPLLAEEGIIVGSDYAQEWLLPWWWDRYCRFNDYPVAFVDFGLSEEMREWCKSRGHFISLPVADIFVPPKEEIAAASIQKWEAVYGKNMWESRNAWFKKPLACLQSRYRKTLWIDLDCEIKGSLKGIFGLCDAAKIVIAREDHFAERKNYNSGVIGFHKDIAIMEDWADLAVENPGEFPGDQEALSHLILQQKPSLAQLPPIYNWSRCSEENSDAVIVHWHGKYGKLVIAHQLGR